MHVMQTMIGGILRGRTDLVLHCVLLVQCCNMSSCVVLATITARVGWSPTVQLRFQMVNQSNLYDFLHPKGLVFPASFASGSEELLVRADP